MNFSDAEGWQKSVNGIHLACDNGHISVTHAKYYAPRNFLCLPMENALSVTQTRCNDLEDCYISTQPNQFYGNPCFLWQKKVEVRKLDQKLLKFITKFNAILSKRFF